MNDVDIVIPNFEKNDYLFSSKPFEWLDQFENNKLKLLQFRNVLSDNANKVGIRNFTALYKVYLETKNQKNGVVTENTTNFDGQTKELKTGQWFADDLDGIYIIDKFGEQKYACKHPLLPIQRLIDIDTGVEKLKIAYKKGKFWREIVCDKKNLSNSGIFILTDYGVTITKKTADYLCDYIADIELLNYDDMDEKKTVSRLGWIGEDKFSPYEKEIEFDGEINFKHFFESVQPIGKVENWLDIIKEVRQYNDVTARLLLATSFASVLIKPLGVLPFILHLWGSTEVGKTVALMLAASVWANPKMGEYIHTFNSTTHALTLSAGFVNSLPLILDELQLIKDKKDFDDIIYMLCEGIGKMQGTKEGGLKKTITWLNCTITSGESPITNSASGGGAVNRIIEVECENSIFENPKKVADTIKQNYGFAGKKFIKMLMQDDNLELAKSIQKDFHGKLQKNETTEKQALSASIILTADKLATDWIFKDNIYLTVDEINGFLTSKKDISNNERAFNYLIEQITVNHKHFIGSSEHSDVWGLSDTKFTYIVRSQFDKIMLDGRYNSQSFLSWLKQNNKIEVSKNGTPTRPKRINSAVCKCVWLKNSEMLLEEWLQEENDDLPF